MSHAIQDIFTEHFPDYKKSHKLPLHIIKAARRIIDCRTIKMGGHAYICNNCHITEHSYNSCKHRFCSLCSGIGKRVWVDRQQKRALDTDHFHLIFTIPSQVKNEWFRNQKEIINILFKASNETINEFLNDDKWLGAQTGKILTLHTWNNKLGLHPHIHALVTAGGLTKDKKWKSHTREYLAPAKAMAKVFRGKFLDYLKKKYKSGDLTIQNKKEFEEDIQRMYDLNWNVHIRPRYDYAKGVIKYLAQYMKGGPVHPSRISILDNNVISIRLRKDKDTGDVKYLKLTPENFFKLYLLHVSIPYLRSTRYYGLYSGRSLDKLNIARSFLGQEELISSETLAAALKESRRMFRSLLEKNLLICPHCKRERILIRNIRPNFITNLLSDRKKRSKSPPIVHPRRSKVQ